MLCKPIYHLSSALFHNRYDLLVLGKAGEVQCRHPTNAPWSYGIRSSVKKELHAVFVHELGCTHQWGLRANTLRVDLDPLIMNKQVQCLQVPCGCRQVQRSSSHGISEVDIQTESWPKL